MKFRKILKCVIFVVTMCVKLFLLHMVRTTFLVVLALCWTNFLIPHDICGGGTLLVIRIIMFCNHYYSQWRIQIWESCTWSFRTPKLLRFEYNFTSGKHIRIFSIRESLFKVFIIRSLKSPTTYGGWNCAKMKFYCRIEITISHGVVEKMRNNEAPKFWSIIYFLLKGVKQVD